MDVFRLRETIIGDYARFTRSFTKVRAPDIRAFLDAEYERGRFWPAPLIQLNPSFVGGATVQELVREGVLDEECGRIFRIGKDGGRPGEDLRLHLHQEEAIRIARAGRSYVLTTGTGSGKSLAYFVPIADRALRRGGGEPRITAIVVYPMNALCNSQLEELRKFLEAGYPTGASPVTFARYTGQESQVERDEIARRPPDILLTNYMMLELILTRQNETDQAVMRAARGLQFLVLDELHTYRGRQGADVALLVRRVREACNRDLLAVGTSATMASEGALDDRGQVVAAVATRMFGAPVHPEDVVTETLARVTPEDHGPDAGALAAAIDDGVPEGASFETLRRHPLAAWIETELGLQREEGKWVRTRQPRSLGQAAELLAETTGRPLKVCEGALKAFLLLAHNSRDAGGRSLFAFRLHQLVTGGGDLFGTLEPAHRYLTLDGQQFQPGTGRGKRLFPFYFCRECGQEYVSVWAREDVAGVARLDPRHLGDRAADDADLLHGFFMPDPDDRYRLTPVEEAFPEEWLSFEHGEPRLRPHYRKQQPRPVRVDSMGERAEEGLLGWLIPRSLRYCLNPDCRVVHGPEVRSDLTKLSGLGTEGRSSATTVLTLSALRHLLDDEAGLSDRARKILAFTDNRQDAALQAGHFNDFVQVLMLRGALLAAIESDSARALTDATLTQRVFEHLKLEFRDYASSPDLKGVAADETRQALRDVLGYRLYFDLRRGWRITNPNLEQLGLLRIDYLSLDEACADVELWADAPDALALAPPEIRRVVAGLVLEAMRRQLCIKTRYLDRFEQERIHGRAFNRLREPWGFSEDEPAEQLYKAAAFAPVARPTNWKREADVAFASYRSKLGRELARPQVWGGAQSSCFSGRMTAELYDAVVHHLLRALGRYGIVERTEVERLGEAWQVNSQALRWIIGEGDSPRDRGVRTVDNPFFRELYRNVAAGLNADERFLHRLEAREHTAQVDNEQRQEREERFRAAELPVLFCSPTMELGVDIAELNTVYMRNLPPTPANYAQRSGRAGRSGQPALVLAYAAAKSPHDQYFFRHPVRMVAGIVSPPTLDLANEDLVSSHLHAVWLAETRQRLPDGVAEVLNRERLEEMPVRADLEAAMNIEPVRDRALARCRGVLAMLHDELTTDTAPWYRRDEWLGRIIATSYREFEQAFERWRSLYRATSQQMRRAQAVMNSAAASPQERDEAKRRHDEAFQQQKLLLDVRSIMNSDFYTYRYLASQGFLPGYNFPRLPLLAYVPARREKIARDSFLSRPRFLALAEFGPRSVIYHEGSQYRVVKAILGVRDEDSVSVEARLPVRACRLCPACGYGHFGDGAEAERCAVCNSELEGGLRIENLYRIDNVATRRAMRITSDEEERLRLGYETITTLQFAQRNGTLEVMRTEVGDREGVILELQYGPAATVWRVNLGWRRRKHKEILGFNIDVLTGRWAKDAQAPDDADADSENGRRTVPQRITPYVEDRRNVLIMFPKDPLDRARMATLQYTLKRGIEREFQLEESELVAEALPTPDNRKALLFYEAAEGGAGVLTRLAADPTALRRVAAKALEVSHFQAGGETWLAGEPVDQDPDCEAGCYRCLLSYYNQPEHEHIDRRDDHVVRLLCRLTEVNARKGSEGRTFEQQFEELMRLSGSPLEKAFLLMLCDGGYRLPDRAQPLIEAHGTRADFGYPHAQALVYIDGPHHEQERQSRLDESITERLEDAGYTVIRFGADRSAWHAILARYPDVFGTGERP